MFTPDQIHRAAMCIGLAPEVIERLLAALADEQDRAPTLTIICNQGVHPIRADQLPGRVFIASSGDLPSQSAEALQAAVEEVCCNLARLLKDEGPFAEIYLVPSGYSVLAQKLAETVFQVTGRTAATLHYDGRTQSYWPINPDLRAVISRA